MKELLKAFLESIWGMLRFLVFYLSPIILLIVILISCDNKANEQKPNLSDRVDVLEERLDAFEQNDYDEVSDRYNELQEKVHELALEVKDIRAELTAESDDRKWEDNLTEQYIENILSRLEECEGIIDNEHPGERG